MALTRDEFATWPDRDIAAWRSGVPGEIGELLSADVTYSQTGGQTVIEGRCRDLREWWMRGPSPVERIEA